ncbi:MAG: GTPase [archaeon]
MPINAHPDYIAAEREYLNAQSLEERIEKLKKMISCVPSHKSAEKLRAQLRTRLRKFLEKKEKNRKTGKSSKIGIKKEIMQAAIVGKTNTGKSSLLSKLTNASPKIAEYAFSSKNPHLGTMFFEGTNIQLIDIPAIESEYFEKGLVNTSDTLLITITSLHQIKEIEEKLEKATKKRIIIFAKSDLLTQEEKRKVNATLCSKKYNFVIASSETGEGINEIKNKLFQSFEKIRIYTKEPKKEKSKNPIILEKNAIVKDVAEKILKGFSNKVVETKIWGPSSKFPGQKVGLNHKLIDLDVVEFKTR